MLDWTHLIIPVGDVIVPVVIVKIPELPIGSASVKHSFFCVLWTFIACNSVLSDWLPVWSAAYLGLAPGTNPDQAQVFTCGAHKVSKFKLSLTWQLSGIFLLHLSSQRFPLLWNLSIKNTCDYAKLYSWCTIWLIYGAILSAAVSCSWMYLGEQTTFILWSVSFQLTWSLAKPTWCALKQFCPTASR